jgi:hypothetical protein
MISALYLFLRGQSDPTFSLLVGFLGGLWFFYSGLRKFRQYKLISDIPDISIRGLSMGIVRTRGTALVQSLVLSPITQTRCCAFKVEIDSWRSEGRGGRWNRQATDIDGPPLYLEGKGGSKVLVDVVHAEWDIPRVTQREVDSYGTGINPAYLQYIQRAQMRSIERTVQGFVHKRLGLNEDKSKSVDALFGAFDSAIQGDRAAMFKIMSQQIEASGPLSDPVKEERRREALNHLRLMSDVSIAPESAVGLREALPLTSLPKGTAADDRFPTFETARPPAATGRYRVTEYCILPAVEYGVTGTCMENPDATSSEDRNLISQGSEEQTLLITSKPDDILDRSLRNRALKMIAGGAAVSVTCLLILLLRL